MVGPLSGSVATLTGSGNLLSQRNSIIMCGARPGRKNFLHDWLVRWARESDFERASSDKLALKVFPGRQSFPRSTHPGSNMPSSEEWLFEFAEKFENCHCISGSSGLFVSFYISGDTNCSINYRYCQRKSLHSHKQTTTTTTRNDYVEGIEVKI